MTRATSSHTFIPSSLITPQTSTPVPVSVFTSTATALVLPHSLPTPPPKSVINIRLLQAPRVVIFTASCYHLVRSPAIRHQLYKKRLSQNRSMLPKTARSSPHPQHSLIAAVGSVVVRHGWPAHHTHLEATLVPTPPHSLAPAAPALSPAPTSAHEDRLLRHSKEDIPAPDVVHSNPQAE